MILAGSGILLWSCDSQNNEAGNPSDKKAKVAEVKQVKGFTDLHDFSKFIFECIKSDDYERLTTNIITKSEVLVLFDQWDADQDDKDHEMEDLDSELKNNIASIKQGFEAIRTSANDAGLIWKNTSFSKISYEINFRENLESALVDVEYLYNDLDYSFSYDCNKCKGVWKLFSHLAEKD